MLEVPGYKMDAEFNKLILIMHLIVMHCTMDYVSSDSVDTP